jgi:HAD superfamily hydrolase (TIGR01509 family)
VSEARIDALIFDFDGLILDTETPDYLSWKEMYAAFDQELPLSVWNKNIGSVDFFNPYLYLEELLGRAIDREAVKAQRKKIDNRLLAAQEALPGVVDYLDAAESMGIKVGIASSSPRAWVESHLTRLELRQRFSLIRGRDDVGDRAKPDPAVYRAALNGLDAAPAQTLALEDSPNGARAALAAGVRCVVVPNRMTRELAFPDVDYRLSALTDMPLAELITAVFGTNQ